MSNDTDFLQKPARTHSRGNLVHMVFSGVCTAMLIWLGNTVISHGNTLAKQGQAISEQDRRLESMEFRGSTALDSHIKVADERLNKLEASVMEAQKLLSEIKAIGVRLDAIKESQLKMERSLEEHMRKP